VGRGEVVDEGAVHPREQRPEQPDAFVSPTECVIGFLWQAAMSSGRTSGKAWRNSNFSTLSRIFSSGARRSAREAPRRRLDVDTDHDDAGGKPHTFGRMAVLPDGERCRRNT
jgi:hypothetical protein